MQSVQNATNVRNDFGSFIDSVVREKPAMVKRSRDLFMALSIPHLYGILNQYRFQMEYEQEDDGSISGSLVNFDLVAKALTVDELKIELANQLIEYANDYYDNFQRYFNAPNRQPHFPFILKILIQDDLDHVIQLIDA